MKKLLFLIFLNLTACTSGPTINEFYVKRDTTFVIPPNQPGWENGLQLIVVDSLSDSVPIETSQEIVQGEGIPNKILKQQYQIPIGVSNDTLVEDYGMPVTVRIKNVQKPFLLRVAAPANDNRGNIFPVSTEVISDHPARPHL